MPNYDLLCQECGHKFSKKLSFSERKVAVCEKCGSKKLEQMYKCCNILGQTSGTGISNNSCTKTGGCGSCTGCR